MSKNFVSLMRELRDAKSAKEKQLITGSISDFLNEHRKFSSSFIVSLMNIMILTSDEPKFVEATHSEFYEYRLKSYIDDDQKIKFFFSVSFLQPYEDFDEELDARIMSYTQTLLAQQNFDQLVNHVAINNIQFKNGKELKLQ